jgi:hypothetical protein
MKISIGMLVYNGAATLPITIDSLLSQQLLRDPDVMVSIHIVANGCTDASVAIAERMLGEARNAQPDAWWSYRVHDLAIANKCQAWEHFVHVASERDAELIVMLDCDIVFGGTDTLTALTRAFEGDPVLQISTSLPVKDVELQAKGMLQWTSSKVNDSRLDEHGVCGQLYAARAAMLRKIHMPLGLSAEDGYIRAMVLTDGFRSAEVLPRVRRAPGARHIFEAHTSPRRIIRHEMWMTCEFVKLTYLYSAFEALPLDEIDRHAGDLVGEWNAQMPGWFAAMFVAASRDRDRLVSKAIRYRRYRAWKQRSLRHKLTSFPKLLLTTALDTIVCTKAEWELSAFGARTMRNRWKSWDRPVKAGAVPARAIPPVQAVSVVQAKATNGHRLEEVALRATPEAKPEAAPAAARPLAPSRR